MRRTLPILGVLLLFSTAASAGIVDSCGDTVGNGVLAGDLDCSGTPGWAITLTDGGSLDLAGHTLTSGRSPDYHDGGGVLCLGSCTVKGGGGTIRSGLPVVPNGDDMNVPSGIEHPFPGEEVPFVGKVIVRNATIEGYDTGVNGPTVRAKRLTATNNRLGVGGRRLRLLKSTVADGGQGLAAFRVALVHTDVVDNAGMGMTARLVFATNSTVSGNGNFGIYTADGAEEGQITATDSTIDENCQDVGYDDFDCADFTTSSADPPVFDNVTCSHSARYSLVSGTWSSWGVCDDD